MEAGRPEATAPVQAGADIHLGAEGLPPGTIDIAKSLLHGALAKEGGLVMNDLVLGFKKRLQG